MSKISLAISGVLLMLLLMAVSFSPRTVNSFSFNKPAEPEPQGSSRRDSFRSGRNLLLRHGVPFDPDLLLEPNWKAKLGPAFKSMPEFRETRVVGKGVQT